MLLCSHSQIDLLRKIFTGLAPPTPFDFVFYRESVPGRLTDIENLEAVELALTNLRQSILNMHRAVADVREKQTLLSKKKERGDNLVNSQLETLCCAPGSMKNMSASYSSLGWARTLSLKLTLAIFE
ncbi:hypothetical protein V7S43_017210 [Phytophthora oleae]|uniref:Uncharacterized protein n=1 Tax=Phytophthora oleae TaxID=2107226 RepID=A0ABD3EU19_9STRA